MKKTVIVFDGYCVLCNNYVAWLAKKDTHKSIWFTTFNSNFIKVNYPALELDNTLYVLTEEGDILKKSRAIKHVLNKLPLNFLFRLIVHLIPLFVSNFFYSLVASKRYKIFGKYESCQMPSSLLKERILE